MDCMFDTNNKNLFIYFILQFTKYTYRFIVLHFAVKFYVFAIHINALLYIIFLMFK